MSTQLAEHAARCAECAGLLREAVRVMADDEDADEHRFLASLKSSQQAWQRQMAQKLSEDRRPNQEPHVRHTMRWKWRLAGAFAVGALAIGIVWLAILQFRHPSPQSGARVQVNIPPAVTSPPAPIPDAKGLPEHPRIAAIALEPGLTRGVEGEKSLKLAPETQAAAVTLLFLDAPPRELSLKVVDSNGREIWTKDLTMTIEAVRARQVRVDIPADRLPAGDYRVVALHVAKGETEHVSDYSFRVIR